MKTYFILLLGLIPMVSNLFGQDTTKVRIEFQTKLNAPVPLFKQIYLGEVNTEGWVGDHYAYQHGTLTKNEFLFNAPQTGYFEKNRSIVIVMPENFVFSIDPYQGNQKWLLTPPGQDYNKSLRQVHAGGWGILISTMALLAVVVDNVARNASYNMEMRHYNDVKNMNMDPGPAPQAPHMGALYLIPAISYGISIPLFVSGRHLYLKNRPYAERIE